MSRWSAAVLAVLIASCGGADGQSVTAELSSPAPTVEVSRPTDAEVGFAVGSGGTGLAAFDHFVVRADSSGITGGGGVLDVHPAKASVLDLETGSVASLELPLDRSTAYVDVQSTDDGVVLFAVECDEPTGENQPCANSAARSFRLADPQDGWTELGFDDTIDASTVTSVPAMNRGANRLTAMTQTFDGTENRRLAIVLDDGADQWRLAAVLPIEASEVCSTATDIYVLSKGDFEVTSDPAETLSQVTVSRVDPSLGTLDPLPRPPVDERYAAIGVKMGCDAEALIVASASVAADAAVFEWDGEAWTARPDLVAGDSRGFPFVRSFPSGVLLTWTEDSPSTRLPGVVLLVARDGANAAVHRVPIDAEVVERPDHDGLVLLPLPAEFQTADSNPTPSQSRVEFLDPSSN